MPTLEQARSLLAEAEALNPGPWIAHSINVARAGQLIAERHPTLDPERAYILGLLHDIGRRAGKTGMRHVIDSITYDDYDLLFQLCDALALPEGFCLIEKRLIDVFLRYGQRGVDASVHTKWQQVFAIQRHFEQAIHCSIYRVLPGVVETTFGQAL